MGVKNVTNGPTDKAFLGVGLLESCCYDVDISLYIGHSRPRWLIDARDWLVYNKREWRTLDALKRLIRGKLTWKMYVEFTWNNYVDMIELSSTSYSPRPSVGWLVSHVFYPRHAHPCVSVRIRHYSHLKNLLDGGRAGRPPILLHFPNFLLSQCRSWKGTICAGIWESKHV